MKFRFREFEVRQEGAAMKVGTDGVLLGAWAGARTEGGKGAEGDDTGRWPLRVADVGTGTGVIALMAAQRWAWAQVVGIEKDEASAKISLLNAATSPYAGRVKVVQTDFALWHPEEPFDLVISNPPFFTEDTAAPDGRRASSRTAGALSPLALIRRGHELLAPGGRLALVAPAEAEEELLAESAFAGLTPRRLCRVTTRLGKPPRRLLAELSLEEGPLERSALALRDSDNNYTQEYTQLTSPFYLWLH